MMSSHEPNFIGRKWCSHRYMVLRTWTERSRVGDVHVIVERCPLCGDTRKRKNLGVYKR